jgi:hypothetical protein
MFSSRELDVFPASQDPSSFYLAFNTILRSIKNIYAYSIAFSDQESYFSIIKIKQIIGLHYSWKFFVCTLYNMLISIVLRFFTSNCYLVSNLKIDFSSLYAWIDISSSNLTASHFNHNCTSFMRS